MTTKLLSVILHKSWMAENSVEKIVLDLLGYNKYNSFMGYRK